MLLKNLIEEATMQRIYLQRILDIFHKNGWNLYPKNRKGAAIEDGPVTSVRQIKQSYSYAVLPIVPDPRNPDSIAAFTDNNAIKGPLVNPSRPLGFHDNLLFESIVFDPDDITLVTKDGNRTFIPRAQAFSVLKSINDISFYGKEIPRSHLAFNDFTFKPLKNKRVKCNQTGAIIRQGNTDRYRRQNMFRNFKVATVIR
jgi:hypothetical protein